MTDLSIKEIFQDQGFCVFRNALTPQDVEELIEATDKALSSPLNTEDLLALNKTGHVHKILYMFDKGEVFLKALAHPSIIKIISTFSDNPKQIVPTWEDMLIKVPFEGVPVTVHQDLALQSVHHEVFSVGIYLHSSHSNPVCYLPGSHKLGALTKEEIYQVYEDQKEAFLPIYADPGDIIVHNVKTVHYSEENKSKDRRYTWYLEFRTLEQLRHDSPWDEDWILSRRAIWVAALKRHAPHMSSWIEDEANLQSYLHPLHLRISHTNDHIQYDQANPYNHF